MKPLVFSRSDEHNIHPVYRADIDGLRALAILSVIVFHAFPHSLPGGFIGVDIFFVISGFLISTIIFRSIQNGNFSFAEFYAHRIKRIFPALIVVLTACYTFGWLTLLPDEFKQLGKHIAASTGFAQNFILWKEVGYFDTAADLKPLLHLWSLAIEEQFYLIFPVLIFAIWRIGLNVLSVVLVFGLVSFSLNIFDITANPTKTFFMLHTRAWELLAGSVLAYLQFFKTIKFSAWMQNFIRHQTIFRHSPESVQIEKVVNNIISIAGLFFLITAVFILNKNKPFPGTWALLPVLGTFLLILAGPEAWINRVVLANRLMVFIGLISYPLYLWHWPILSFARIIEGELLSLEIRMAVLALSFILAWLTYRLIEKPFRLGQKTWIKTAALTLGLATVGYLGFNTYQRSGLPSRIPSEIREIANFQYEYAKDARAGICWLSAEQPSESFGSECTQTPNSNDNNLIFVWGDSHAARLYPGLRATLGDQAGISQLTRDSCPPIIDYGYITCQKSNEHVISKIRQLNPTTVVMFAVWDNYESDWGIESQARLGLLKTVRQLKQLGVKNIVVLGPAPNWNQSLPKLVYNAWKGSFPRKIPERLASSLELKTQQVDMQLQMALLSEEVRYVSVLGIFCREDGCLTHVPGRPSELLTWDYGHLTTSASAFLSRRLMTDKAFP